MHSRRAKLTYTLIFGCLFIVLMSGRDTPSQLGPGVIVPQVRDSFMSGGNVAYSAGRAIYRKFHSGPIDPTFNQEEYIKEHRERIPDEQMFRFMGTTNRQEADWLLSDYESDLHKQQLIEARGEYSAILGWWIASGLAPMLVLLALIAIRRYGNTTTRTQALR